MSDLEGTASRLTAKAAFMLRLLRVFRSSAHGAGIWARFRYQGIPTTWPLRVPTRKSCTSLRAAPSTRSRCSQKGTRVGRNRRNGPTCGVNWHKSTETGETGAAMQKPRTVMLATACAVAAVSAMTYVSAQNNPAPPRSEPVRHLVYIATPGDNGTDNQSGIVVLDADNNYS